MPSFWQPYNRHFTSQWFLKLTSPIFLWHAQTIFVAIDIAGKLPLISVLYIYIYIYIHLHTTKPHSHADHQ